MSLLSKIDKLIKAKLLLSSVKLSQEQLADGSNGSPGTLIQYDGDSIEKDDVIYKVAGDGTLSVLPDGQYPLKSGQTFVIADGTIASVSDQVKAADAKSEPTKQAQSSDKVEVKAEEVKQDEVKKEDVADPVEDAPAEQKQDQPDIQSLIDKALAPVLASIQSLQTMAASNKAESDKTQQSMSKITDLVAVLASQSSVDVKETPKALNPFNKEVPVDIKETREYQIFAQAQKNNKTN